MSETINESDNPTEGEVVDALNDPNFTPPAEDGPWQAKGGEAEPAPGLIAPVPDAPKQGQDKEVRVPSPIYLPKTGEVVFPVVNGVGYRVDDKPVSGSLSVEEARTVTAVMENGHKAAEGSQLSWTFSPAAED